MGICHLLIALPHDAPLPSGGELKGSSREHMTAFLAQTCAPQANERGGEERATARVLVDSAQCHLQQLLEEHSAIPQGEGLKQLVEMFENSIIATD